MFAFCTMTNQKVCGISDTTATDMSINAKFEDQTITPPVPLLYTEGTEAALREDRKYDSCYYQIGGEVTEDKLNELQAANSAEDIKIHLVVSKATNMNVYLYSGKNRLTALVPMVVNNEVVTLGTTYVNDYKTGLVLVAYPTEDTVTEFEYTMKLVATPGPAKEEEVTPTPTPTPTPEPEVTPEETTPKEEVVVEEEKEVIAPYIAPPITVKSSTQAAATDDSSVEILLIIVCGAAGILLILGILACCAKSNSGKKNQVEIIEDK